MGVYNDLANDAGYAYGTEENQQMAMMLEWEEMVARQRYYEKQQYIKEYVERYYEILFRKFDWDIEKGEQMSNRATYGIYWKSSDEPYYRLAFRTRDIKEAKRHLVKDIIVVMLDPKREYREGEILVDKEEEKETKKWKLFM